MNNISVGNPQNVETDVMAYTQFRGVDFTTAATQVDPTRSPDARNMIAL